MQSSWIEQRAVRKTMDLVEKARMSSGFDDEILTGVLVVAFPVPEPSLVRYRIYTTQHGTSA